MTRGLTIDEIEWALQQRSAGTSWRVIGILLAQRKGRRVVYLENSMIHACRPFMVSTDAAASNSEK